MTDLMHEVARAVFDQIPPTCQLRDCDARIIKSCQEPFMALEPRARQGVHETVYARQAISAVLAEGELQSRKARYRTGGGGQSSVR